jgi:integrase
MESAMKFDEQASSYLKAIASRKRRPARANTLATYRFLLNLVSPVIGWKDLSEVDNAAVKLLAGRLAEARLSPATISSAVAVVKQVVGSALDANGNALYPRTWNTDFIDAPAVDPTAQRTPVTAPETISQAISRAPATVQALVGLLAGSGLRIGEALVLKAEDDGVANYWNPSTGTIQVRATMTRAGFQPAPKTKAGVREVNLDPELNTFLQESLGSVHGFLFPQSYWTYTRELKKLGIEGGHSLRRARETYLEGQGVPRMLMKFWQGHAAGDITERYIKFGPQIEERKQMAVKAGLGFEL